MSGERQVRAYRRLTRAYPRAFVDEYGPDMVLVFREQLRDEGPIRVWLRTLVDLALTIPNRHLEARMSAPTPFAPVLFGAVGIAGLVTLAVGGTSRGSLIVGLVMAIVGFGLAVAALRRARPLGVDHPARGWQLVAVGGLILVGLVVGTTVIGDLGEYGWFIAMATGLTAVIVLAAGVILVATELTRRHRPAA